MAKAFLLRLKRKTGGFAFLENRRDRLIALCIGAVLTALTLIFTELWILEWVSLIPSGIVILYFGEKTNFRLRTYYGYGLLFFWSYYIVVFHWFASMYSLTFTGLSAAATVAVILAGIFGLSFLQALISAFAFVIYGLACKSNFVRKYSLLRPSLFAACFTIFEWLQTFGWWGVPWGRLSLGQIGFLANVQTAQWFGSYFVSFLILCVNLCLAYAAMYVPLRKIVAVTACAVFTANLLCGTVLLLTDRDTEDSFTVAAIQGNIDNKWDVDSLQSIKDTYEAYTLLAAEDGAKVIVWPETTLPFDLEASPSVMKFVRELAEEADAILLVGAFRTEENENGELTEYNSLYAISPDGTVYDTVYDKQHLVPFGEFVPMRAFVETVFPPLADVAMLEEDLTSGEAGKNIVTDVGELGCLICFDSIYESATLAAVRNGAELLCLSSNDSWFLDSAALDMHHVQARLRAIESGRYLVRSGNSGITSVLSPTGAVLAELEPMTEGYVTSEVCLRTDRTLYSHIGNLFVWILVVGVGGICISAIVSAVIGGRTRKRTV